MFKTVEDLQKMIVWAKEQGVKSFKVADVTVEISDHELAKRLMEMDANPKPKTTEARDTQKTMLDTLPVGDDDEDLLFASST